MRGCVSKTSSYSWVDDSHGANTRNEIICIPMKYCGSLANVLKQFIQTYKGNEVTQQTESTILYPADFFQLLIDELVGVK